MSAGWIRGLGGPCLAALLFAGAVHAQTTSPASLPQTPARAQQAPVGHPPATTPPAASQAPKYIEVPPGTRLPLVLHNGISTRTARTGDTVYLETLFPIVQNNRVLIPAGSYISGEITMAKRPGRVKGRGELRIKLDNLILPNGYAVSFNAIPTGADTGGRETVQKEGTVTGDSNKAGDAATVASTTGAGAGIGGLATRTGEGVGIGAGIGLAAGLAAVLLTRGPDAELPRGTTLDIVLNRPLFLEADKLNFTNAGQASALPGPPNREPRRVRPRIPFVPGIPY